MAKLLLVQYSMESLSRMDPPGCMNDVMPAACAIFTQSSKGKNASLAKTAPCRSALNCFAFSIACLSESMREVCPHPFPIRCLSFTIAMALLFKCLQMILANARSFFFGRCCFSSSNFFPFGIVACILLLGKCPVQYRLYLLG